MRIAPTIVAVPLLVLLLTWLSLRAANLDAEQFYRALGELDHFSMVEAAVHRDVLNMRIGVLRNYDPLVQEVNALSTSLAQLRETVASDEQTVKVIDRLAQSVRQREALVEKFKSSNALLQNSLAYFSMFSDRLVPADQIESMTPGVGALAAAMLRLTLDTSSTTALAVEDRLNELAREPVSPGDAEAVNALLAHGRLLHDLLPATDAMLKSLCGAPEKANRILVRDLIGAHQEASRATAHRFRVVLYITSLALVAALVYLGLQLQQRASALRRRAAFEHVLAGISIRFLNSRPQHIDRNIDQALAEMAECVGADRAYFAVLGPSPCLHRWSRGDITYPPNWPERAPALAAKFNPAFEGIVQVVDANALARGAE